MICIRDATSTNNDPIATSAQTYPTATAILPLYNGSEVLASCVQSLLEQGRLLHEILIINDASTDSSLKIVQDIIKDDERVRIINHTSNRGLAQSLNDGIAAASGEAILIIQQDCELIGSDWVERALRLLNANQPCCVSGSPVYVLGETSAVDIAFGILRDTFYTPEQDREELAFSEFKCDLLPKRLAESLRFNPRFRVSGEDQALSGDLSIRGFKILRFREIKYRQRFGNVSKLSRQIRKEAIYGASQAGVLLQTSLRMIPSSSKSPTSKRRLLNRLTCVISSIGLLSLISILSLGGLTLLALPFLLLVLSRVVIIGLRSIVLRRNAGLPLKPIILSLVSMPLADAAYSFSLVVGFFAFTLRGRV